MQYGHENTRIYLVVAKFSLSYISTKEVDLFKVIHHDNQKSTDEQLATGSGILPEGISIL